MSTLSAADLTDAYRDQITDPVAATMRHLDAAHAAAEAFNAYAYIDPAGALAAARASAQRWEAGTPLGPLDGVPISFKDSFHIRGLPRWHGTAISTGPRSTYDCAPVRRAREAGMVIIGKTTMPDYAMLMSGQSSQHGVITNPWDQASNPAGSSSGAGPSVVSGSALVALGTDMVGSVRLPAAVCGLPSIKPTQGRIAYDPAGSYRSAGPMARSVGDVEAALSVFGREDRADHLCLPGCFVPADDADAHEWVSGRRVGVITQMAFGTAIDEPTARALATSVEILAAAGANIEYISELPVGRPDFEAVYWHMIYRGMADYLAHSAADRGRILPVVGEMLDAPSQQSAVYATETIIRMEAATARLRAALDGFDLIISPVLPVRSFGIDDLSSDPDDPMAHMGFACWFNNLGMPAGTVPIHDPGDGGVPVSVQVVGTRFADAQVLAVMKFLESQRGFTVDYPGVS